jgi:hypothetical protein
MKDAAHAYFGTRSPRDAKDLEKGVLCDLPTDAFTGLAGHLSKI